MPAVLFLLFFLSAKQSCETMQATWNLEDSSSNGTFINQVRVPKARRQPLAEGDHVRLSQAPDNNPAHIIE